VRNSAFFGDRRSWYEIFAHNQRERYRAMSKPPSSKPPRIRNAGNRGGRPPKPVQLHKIEGTYQPVRHAGRGDRLEAPGELSGKRPPIWMDDAQRKLWREVLADAPRGVLRRIDAVLFANYIELLDRYRRLVAAQRQLDRAQPMPFLVKGHDGVAVSPYLRPLNHCVLLLTRWRSANADRPGPERCRHGHKTGLIALRSSDGNGQDHRARGSLPAMRRFVRSWWHAIAQSAPPH
jgi:hypothetical protein